MPEVVIVDFDAEDDGGACESDDISDSEGNVAPQESVDHKEERAEPHHRECHHRYSVGVACADGHYGLRQIAEYHAYAGKVAEYICNSHSLDIKNYLLQQLLSQEIKVDI